MNRGFAEEILSFSLIIFSVIIMTVFFASESVLKGGEVGRSVRGRTVDESANMAIQTLYDNKLEEVKKTYMELIVDAHMQGDNETLVYYRTDGEGLGQIPVSKVITPLFNKYFGEGGWKLVVRLDGKRTEYGNLKKESKYKYVSNIPVPPSVSKNNIGNVTLHV